MQDMKLNLGIAVVVGILVVSNVYVYFKLDAQQKQMDQDEKLLSSHDEYIYWIFNTPTINSMVMSYVQSQQELVQELPEATTTEHD